MWRLVIAAMFLAALGCRGEGKKPVSAQTHSPSVASGDTSPTEGGGAQRRDDDPLVASREDDRVSLAELQAFLDGFPEDRRAAVAPAEGRRTFLRNYLLYRAALRQAGSAGYADDPRIRRIRDREMALRWTEDLMASYQAPPITDAEVQARWAQDKPVDRPTLVRARHILTADLATAEALRCDLLATLARPGADAEAVFSDFAGRHSLDEKTRSKGGDLLFFSRDRGEVAWRLAPPSVLEAALAMRNVGQVSLPLEGPAGFHLVMVTGRRDAVLHTIEDAAPGIRTALAQERTAAARKAVEAELLDMDDWTVDDGVLRDLVVAP